MSTWNVGPFDGDAAAWDAFVDGAPDATFCHLAGWRAVIEDVMGHGCTYRVARDGAGRIGAVLPLARLRTRVLGDHLVSLPFLNYGGPVGEPAARLALARQSLAEAGRLGLSSFSLRTREAIGDDLPTAQRKVTVLLDLPPTADELWNDRFNSKFRNKIKRPQREGMETRFGTSELGAFYEVFAVNMRDLGTPVLPRAFFERIVATFPELVVVGATYHEGRPVAGGFGFLWRGEFEMTWSSSLRSLGALKPNMLLYWEYMRELIGRGAHTFNFGRSTPGAGTHEFKLSWGSRDVPLPWIEWPVAPGDDATADQGDRSSRLVQLASTTWQRLPIGLANRLGPHVARALPWW